MDVELMAQRGLKGSFPGRRLSVKEGADDWDHEQI